MSLTRQPISHPRKSFFFFLEILFSYRETQEKSRKLEHRNTSLEHMDPCHPVLPPWSTRGEGLSGAGFFKALFRVVFLYPGALKSRIV